MTFSIVARCTRTGEFGIGAATAVPAVGKLLTWAYPGAGAVATQAWVNPYLGYDAIEALREGQNAHDTLETVLARDPDRDIRQVGVVDAQGRAAAWSGPETDDWAGHITGEGYSIQGNLLTGGDTLTALEHAFREHGEKPLAERILCALEAAEAVGGDKRGASSATVYVIEDEIYPLWDLRVDDHPRPMAELRRLYGVFEREVVPHVRRLPKREMWKVAREPGEISIG